MKTLTGTLMNRVSRLLPAMDTDARPEWGSAALSTTPTPLAIQDLAARVEALENAVREIAEEVQQLATHPEERSSAG